MADIRALAVGNFASVSSTSLFSVAVEDFQNAAAVCGVHTVLIRSPDRPPVFLPAYTHSVATGVRDSKHQWLTDSESSVFQLPDEASRFCEEAVMVVRCQCDGEAEVIITIQNRICNYNLIVKFYYPYSVNTVEYKEPKSHPASRLACALLASAAQNIFS